MEQEKEEPEDGLWGTMAIKNKDTAIGVDKAMPL